MSNESSEHELPIKDGGEDMRIFDIMDRYRSDGSCERIIQTALIQMAKAQHAEADAQREPELARLMDIAHRMTITQSGTALCACKNINAVRSGMEKPCGYCEMRSALDAVRTRSRPTVAECTSCEANAFRLAEYHKIGSMPAIVKGTEYGAESLAECVEMAVDRWYRRGVEDGKKQGVAPTVASETLVLNVAQRDTHFRKWMIEQLTAMGDKQDIGPFITPSPTVEAAWLLERNMTPEGIEAARRRKADVARKQQELEASLEALPKILRTDNHLDALVKWVDGFIECADDVAVTWDSSGVVRQLKCSGYLASEYVGQQPEWFNTRTRMGRYLIGQAISCMERGLPPHPITHSFAKKYFDLASEKRATQRERNGRRE